MKMVFFYKFAMALFGLTVWAVSSMSANAQDHSLNVSSVAGISSSSWNDERSEEPPLEEIDFEIDIQIEEEPTITFVNKAGEVEAVLKGNKAAFEKFNKERLNKSYLLSSFGNHEVYLLR